MTSSHPSNARRPSVPAAGAPTLSFNLSWIYDRTLALYFDPESSRTLETQRILKTRLRDADLPKCTTRSPERATHLIIDISAEPHDFANPSLGQHVVSLDWFHDSFVAEKCLPEEEYHVETATEGEESMGEEEEGARHRREAGDNDDFDPKAGQKYQYSTKETEDLRKLIESSSTHAQAFVKFIKKYPSRSLIGVSSYWYRTHQPATGTSSSKKTSQSWSLEEDTKLIGMLAGRSSGESLESVYAAFSKGSNGRSHRATKHRYEKERGRFVIAIAALRTAESSSRKDKRRRRGKSSSEDENERRTGPSEVNTQKRVEDLMQLDPFEGPSERRDDSGGRRSVVGSHLARPRGSTPPSSPRASTFSSKPTFNTHGVIAGSSYPLHTPHQISSFTSSSSQHRPLPVHPPSPSLSNHPSSPQSLPPLNLVPNPLLRVGTRPADCEDEDDFCWFCSELSSSSWYEPSFAWTDPQDATKVLHKVLDTCKECFEWSKGRMALGEGELTEGEAAMGQEERLVWETRKMVERGEKIRAIRFPAVVPGY